ncbi:MAG: AmmeMemoRadiSam system protein A [Butyrivibrio sp.]|nr:AmmeMemoRadiSam system protein A [Butyrivibrio sp.]
MSFAAAFMVPHPPLAIHEVGKGDEEAIAKTLESFDTIARIIAEIEPDTIVVTSPHAVMYSDYFHISPGEKAYGDMGRFGAPEIAFEADYDTEFVDKLCHEADKLGIPAGTLGERDKALDHGVLVPAYFINRYYCNYDLVRIGLSGLSLKTHYNFGRLLRKVADETDKKIVLIASGDLSHCQKEDGPYGFSPEGPEYDEKLMDIMGRGAFTELLDFDESFLEKAQECGHRSFCIMAGTFHNTKVDVQMLSHEATFGVGYGLGIFIPRQDVNIEAMEDDHKDPYVKLARQTIENFVRGQELPDLFEVPGEMLNTKAGAFVSVHELGMLRGCIGTISATCESVAEEIRQNAVSAVSRDPRFSPVVERELDKLEISVDVLGEAEPIESKDMLDIKKYGVIVESGVKRGLLLPDLEGVDSIEQQIDIARQKAGIRFDEDYKLYRFEVIRHV